MCKNISILCLTVASLSILLSSCSYQYVSTNFDKDNFHDYFSAAKVDIYDKESDIEGKYRLISSVEGQDCQSLAHHAIPDEVNARTQARQQAFSNHANGVVFTGCTLLSNAQLEQLKASNDSQQCHAVIVCYAKAYQIDTNE